MPTPNTELLQQVLKEIEYYPNSWDPNVIARRENDEWGLPVYGTEGLAIALTHRDALWHWMPEPDRERFGSAWFAVLVSIDGSRKKPGRNAAFIARQLLGLDRAQALRLFGARTLDEVRGVISELCEGGDPSCPSAR